MGKKLKKNQDDQWKGAVFENWFCSLVGTRVNRSNISAVQAFSLYQSFNQDLKKDFFQELRKLTGIDAKVMKAYFHNVFSKKFLSDPKKYKAEIVQLIEKYINEGYEDTIDIVKSVIEHFGEIDPQLQFHYQSLYQFCNYNKDQAMIRIRHAQYRNAMNPTVEPQVASPVKPTEQPVCAQDSLEAPYQPINIETFINSLHSISERQFSSVQQHTLGSKQWRLFDQDFSFY